MKQLRVHSAAGGAGWSREGGRTTSCCKACTGRGRQRCKGLTVIQLVLMLMLMLMLVLPQDKNLCLGGVDELVQGLPSLRTTTRGPSLTGTSDLSGTGMLPLPGVSPQPRFARVAPLLKSPSIGRLFTHMQLRELTDSTRRSASRSDAGGGGYKQNASEPGFVRNPGATPFGASPSRPGSVQSSGEGGLPPVDGKPGSVQLPPGPPGARPNGMTQRRCGPCV